MPASMRMVVVLPAPFGPRNPTISPSPTAKVMPATASTSPKRLVTSRSAIAAARAALVVSPHGAGRGVAQIVQLRNETHSSRQRW